LVNWTLSDQGNYPGMMECRVESSSDGGMSWLVGFNFGPDCSSVDFFGLNYDCDKGYEVEYSQYQFRVIARNQVGEGAPSAPFVAHLGVPPPAAPTGLSAQTTGSDSMLLAWQEPANNCKNPIGRTVWFERDGYPIGQKGPGVVSELGQGHAVITGMRPATTYTFKVRTYGSSEGGWSPYSQEVVATTGGCSTTYGLLAPEAEAPGANFDGCDFHLQSASIGCTGYYWNFDGCDFYPDAGITPPDCEPAGTWMNTQTGTACIRIWNSADLENASFVGADLKGNQFIGANLTGANLTGANLSGAILTGATLSGANLTGATLGAYLAGANLTGANLSGANLAVANLSGANLTGVDLSGLNLSGANLSEANLSLVVGLKSANLTNANLAETDLQGFDLSGVNLTGANLTGANLTNTDLSGATLVGADFSHYGLGTRIWTGTNLTNADLTGADLYGVYLGAVVGLPSANLTNANLVETDLNGLSLYGIVLSGANLTGANLSNTTLSGADLSGAFLLNADLSGTSLRATIFAGANLSSANLTGAYWFASPDGDPSLGLNGAICNASTVWPSDFVRLSTWAGPCN
jgi:uncharacterized protein YjbI with pentapeptide repeats